MALKNRTLRWLWGEFLFMFFLGFVTLGAAISMTVWACWENWLGGTDGDLQSVRMSMVAAAFYVLYGYPLVRGWGPAMELLRRGFRFVMNVTARFWRWFLQLLRFATTD